MAQRLRTEERLLTNSNPIALPRHPTSASSWTWTSGFVRVLVVTEVESLVWLENPSILLFSCFTLLVVYWRGTIATFFAFVLPFSSDSCWSSVGVWSTTGSCHGKPWAARATGASATHEQPSPSSCCHSARVRLDCLAMSLSLFTWEDQILFHQSQTSRQRKSFLFLFSSRVGGKHETKCSSISINVDILQMNDFI